MVGLHMGVLSEQISSAVKFALAWAPAVPRCVLGRLSTLNLFNHEFEHVPPPLLT